MPTSLPDPCAARRAARVLAAVLLASSLAAAPAAAAAAEETPEQRVTVRLDQRDVTVDPAGSFAFTVTAGVTVPTEYLEVRLRIRNPSGSLLFQKTEVRHGLEPGDTSIGFGRELEDLSLPEGRYPVDVRVLATGSDPTAVEDRMLVMEDGRPAVRVALVARFHTSPGTDPDGRFVVDPEVSLPTLDDAIAVTAVARSAGPVTIALPPATLDDWTRASAGYLTAGPEGVRETPADGPVPLSYAGGLRLLADAVDADVLELLDVPYAEPDLAGLQAMVALEDLGTHYERGGATYALSLGASPTAGTAIRGDAFPPEAAGLMAARDLRFALVAAGATVSGDATAQPGAYPDAGSGMTLLVIDEEASASLASGTAADFVDRLFDVALASAGTTPVVAQMVFGPGTAGDPRALAEAATVLSELTWAEAVSASDAARSPSGPPITLSAGASQGAPAPIGYWGEVLEARRSATALAAAAGDEDPDAAAAIGAMLVAESRLWAGPDDGWGLADRGRSFAAAAVRVSQEVLAAVTVSAEDVTLAGREGRIPLSIVNGTDKTLRVTVSVTGEHARVGPPSLLETELRPAENYLTLPVSMSTALSDRLTIEILAGGTVIGTTRVEVRASYLDRLAVVAFVVLVLAVLLFYIRRRVMS